MKVAVHQPNYIPWLGYFAKLANADVFIFLDDVQLPQGRSYVHRAKIHSPAGGTWLSAPIRREERPLIRDVRFAEDDWRRRHQATLFHTYRKAPFFNPVMRLVEEIYACDAPDLAGFNRHAVIRLAEFLGLSCRYELSSSFQVASCSDERLIELVKAVGGDTYISGAGGQNYQSPKKFEEAGIELSVREYKPRPYWQGPGEFLSGLSVLDALFQLGPGTADHLTYEAEAVVEASPLV